MDSTQPPTSTSTSPSKTSTRCGHHVETKPSRPHKTLLTKKKTKELSGRRVIYAPSITRVVVSITTRSGPWPRRTLGRPRRFGSSDPPHIIFRVLPIQGICLSSRMSKPCVTPPPHSRPTSLRATTSPTRPWLHYFPIFGLDHTPYTIHLIPSPWPQRSTGPTMSPIVAPPSSPSLWPPLSSELSSS